ncbi:hypothetical protein BCR42DRAFT_354068, partial [Absidia repens]
MQQQEVGRRTLESDLASTFGIIRVYFWSSFSFIYFFILFILIILPSSYIIYSIKKKHQK